MTSPRAQTLNAVFSLLESADLPYCVMHGYEGFPETSGSDIDIIVPVGVTSETLRSLLFNNREKLGARIVRQSKTLLVLLCDHGLASPSFLILDFTHECQINGVPFIAADEILASRVRSKNFAIPRADIEFVWLVARCLAAGGCTAARAAQLANLIRQDEPAIKSRLGKVWSPVAVDRLIAAARNKDWLKRDLAEPAAELHRCLARAKPFYRLRGLAEGVHGRIKRLINPPGFHLAMLGPDGAGKSSVIEALERTMVGSFSRTKNLGFAPSMFKLWRKGPVDTSTPHALKARSWPVSVLRSGFWLAYNLSGYVTLRLAKARSVLIVNDRHFIDVLVDPVRYRYAGPRWLIEFIAAVIPRPDAVVLLHGPAEVLQARKRELTLAETERQCHDYLALVQGKRNCHVVNAAQHFEGVMRDVCDILFPPLEEALVERVNPVSASSLDGPSR